MGSIIVMEMGDVVFRVFRWLSCIKSQKKMDDSYGVSIYLKCLVVKVLIVNRV